MVLTIKPEKNILAKSRRRKQTRANSVVMFTPNIRTGVLLSFVSLLLLGLMPVISNSRPQTLNALNFALYLSIWQLVCALPLFIKEITSNSRGIFDARLTSTFKNKTILIIVVTGVIFGISTFVYVLSFEKAGTVSAAIAIQAYPLFAILWETIFLNRKKSVSELFFTLLLVIGLYYMATSGTWRIEGLSLWFVFALGIPFLWSVAHVIIKEVLDKTPITPGQVTFFRVFVSSIILIVIAITVNGMESVLNGLKNFEFQMFAILMGFVYYLELINWFYAVKHIDVSLASSITTPAPVLTMILALIFLHEPIQHYHIIAMFVVLISIYGILYSGKRKRLLKAAALDS